MGQKLLTVAEVADIIGCTPKAVYRLVEGRKLPYIRWGERAVRVHPQALEGFLAARTVAAR